MSVSSSGLHHVTAIAGRAQANIEFYVRLLGLRLVKRTVNYEDPKTYHFYFGDALGNPGSLISFFPWPGAGGAVRGQSESLAVSFRVPPGALDAWRERLEIHGLAYSSTSRFGRAIISFDDPDGTPLELVEGQEPPAPPAPRPAGTAPTQPTDGAIALDTLLAPTRYWTGSSVPPEEAIMALDTVTLNTADPAATAKLLSEIIGWRPDPGASAWQHEAGAGGAGADEAGAYETGTDRLRLIPAGSDPAVATALEIVKVGTEGSGRLGSGSIHHVAFRLPDAEALDSARELLLEAGLSPTKPRNRTYFRSVYFRDPAGAILELATDTPGFLIDEPADELGLAFKLPEWLEPDRQALRAQLPVTASPEYADHFQ